MVVFVVPGIYSGSGQWVQLMMWDPTGPERGLAPWGTLQSLLTSRFHPAFPPQIIKKLIERKQAQIRKVYPGLTCFKEGVRQIPIESVPGIRESCWLWWERAVWPEGSVVPCLRAWVRRADSVTFVFQEKRDGNHWGRKRGECCFSLPALGWGSGSAGMEGGGLG